MRPGAQSDRSGFGGKMTIGLALRKMPSVFEINQSHLKL